MELLQLENIWKEYNKKLAQNTSINKEILKRMLISKPEKRLSWIKIKAGFNTLSPVIFFTLILILDVQFHFQTNFYIGLALFLPVYLITYLWDIKYFKLVRKINFTMPVLSIKKTIAELEKYKIKTTRIKYLLMPVAMIGFFLMIIQKITFRFDVFSILPLLLIIIVFLLSLYFTFKYSIYDLFKKLNSEIDEILMLEKE
jgi:cation transport ATPase